MKFKRINSFAENGLWGIGCRICLCVLAALLLVPFAQTARGEEAAVPAQEAPETPADQFKAIQQMAADGEYQAAARSLQAFIRANATWEGIEDANRLYGITLIQSGDVSVGSEVLARLIDAAPEDPKNAPCYYYRGRALEALGDFPGAVLAYDVLVRRFPKNELAPQAALNEALLAEKILQNPKRAREIYELFAKNYPEHETAPAVMNHLALMAEQANQIEPAVKLYVDYAQKYPDDVGNPAMNGAVAGSAAALWHAAELSAARLGKPAEAVKLFKLYDDLAGQGKLPQAEKGKGYRQATLIALGNPEAGDANELFKLASAANPDDEDLQIRYANWLAGPGKNPEAAAAQYLALATSSENWDLVKNCLDRLGPDRVKAYLDQNPRHYAIFKHYLMWFKDGDNRGKGRSILDQWLTRKDIGWKTSIAEDWAEWTKESADYERLLKAANEEGCIVEATKAALAVADDHLRKNENDKALAVINNTLDQWAAYPDFPKSDFAVKLHQIAVKQPLMVKKLVQPKPAEGQENPPADAKPVEQMVVSPEAKAARELAVNLIRKHSLNKAAAGAAALADLATELNLPESYDFTKAALAALLEANDLNGASKQVDRLFEKIAPDSPDMIDVLATLADKGHNGWDQYWSEKILPKAKAELDKYSAVNPPTELSRYAKAQLLRFFDAKQSVAAHQDFLKNHAGSSRATAVRQNLWAEMQRSGIDPTPQILQAIKEIEKNPAVIYAIPLERVPAGPEGYDLYVKSVKKINTQNKILAADLLLSVARLQVRFAKMGDAMDSLRELITKYGDTPQAADGKRLAAKVFAPGFFTPGLTQADAEQAFAWNAELVLAGEESEFAGISGNLWRLACHPAYRMHSFEDLDSQYMFSTHGYLERQKQLNEYVNGMYATYPGDGIGPQENSSSGTTPYGGGDRFMLYRWSLLRAPVDGTYNFWFGGDDWVGIDIDGRSYNIPEQAGNAHAAVQLTRGLHILRIIFADWGGGSSMNVEWQVPGGQRIVLGPEAFGSEINPLFLSVAAENQGTFGLTQWDAYVRKFPNDIRGKMMRLETLVLYDPSRAMGELDKLVQQYPANLRFKALYADCQWRIGRKEDALEGFASLADQQEHELWACSYNDACQTIFLRGKTPVSMEDDYQDRIVESGAWKRWLSQAENQGGDNAALAARVSAEGTLEVLKQRLQFRQSGIGRVSSALAKEKAQYEAAKALAEKPDAGADVKAQALAAVNYSQRRIAELEQEVKTAQAELQKVEGQLAAFQKAVGLSPDEPAINLPLKFAASRLEKGTLAADSVFKLAARLVHSGKREEASPFLEYVVAFSSDAGQVRWSVDRLVELGVAGEDVTRAAQILASMGMRNPRDGTHAEWLRRSCDLALEAGDVYTFARSAQVLARLHQGNNRLTSYLDRLGEVFEKAGNYTSAEYEYRRVIRSARDPEQKRQALLSLAGLYEKLGRSQEALKVLSNLVRLDLLDGKQESGPTPKAVKEGEAPVEDAAALLLAARCYISLEKSNLALDCYDRAAAQKEFGGRIKPERELLMDLAHACVIGNAATNAKQAEGDQHAALPLVVLQRGEKALNLVDTIFRFYSKQMDAYQTVQATLVRVDANIMMRNYPRAVEEVREAAKAAGDTSAKYLADLKMGELHLATDNPDQAIPIFKKLAKMNSPEVSPIALFWLGSTQLNMNKREDAIESFRVLWERYSDNQLVRQAIYTIARTYAEQGAFLDAIRLYEAVGAIHSKICEKVAPGDVLTVKVWDADHFLGTGEYTIPVQVRSSSGDLEHLQLDMNKINHSLFLGTIRTELGEANHDDKILQVYGTDIIYVSYIDRFKGLTRGEEMTAANVTGEKTTSLIQVVEDADLKVSPTVFVEREEDEEDIYVEKTEAELEEEKRLRALSAKLERGEAVIRPGNYVYVRVQDGDLDKSPQQDEVTVNVFTYAAEIESKQREIQNLERQMSDPLGLRISSDVPSNGSFGWKRHFAPRPDNRPRLDEVKVVLKETEPHSGIFYGKVKTNVNGPTAIASDVAGQNAAVYAIDGKNGADDVWMGFIDNKPGKWLEIDLKELREVSKIVWDRGEGADDRYMIDYTVTLRGEGAPVVIEQKGNRSAHNVEIPLKTPVKCRWIRFTALTYEGDAPAISQVQVFDQAGEIVVPPKTPPTERVKNDILEFNVGDCMAAELLDEENFDPARPVTRTSNALGVAYVDGHVDAVYLSQGRNPYKGSLFIDEQDNDQDWYARRTKRIGAEDVLRVAILDPDLDIDDMLNTAECEIFSSTGDKAVLKAEEIGPTAAIFQGRIQLSANPAAMQDDNRLYVQNGGIIMLRYLDEQNRNPGNAIYRESFIFVADDEVADFALDTVAIESPQAVENQIEPPHWVFSIKEPDQALPGIDRVEMNAMSFATGDYAKFVVLLRNLDGLFSSRLPVGIGDKPDIPVRKGADPRDPRQIRTLDDWGWWERQQKMSQGQLTTAELEEENYLDIPLAVVGDDLVWVSYKDKTAAVPAGKKFVAIADTETLNNLQKLGVRTDLLPDEAKTVGIKVELNDPYLDLVNTVKDREKDVLHEIARKKLHYRGLLEKFDAALERIGKRIEELTPKVEQKESTEEVAETPPETIAEGDAPLTQENPVQIEGLEGEDLMATEDLILAASLRRERDALAKASKALRARLKTFDRYNTAKFEQDILEREKELRLQAEQVAQEGTEDDRRQRELPWYRKPDWWKNCGGIIPGTLLDIRLDDPDIQGESVPIQVAVLGNDVPQFQQFTATAVAGEKGVFEVKIPTSSEEKEGSLCLKGVRDLLFTYRDTIQSKFPSNRSGFLSLASNASLEITGPDFLEAKSSFHLGEEIYVMVHDTDMDKTSERDYVWIEITSDVGDKELVPICESQAHTGIFRGSIRTEYSEPVENDGVLSANFGGTFSLSYVDELWRSETELPPTLTSGGSFVPGSDGTVEIFARQLKRGSLQRDVLFSTALAEYELGKSSTEMGAVQRGRQHLLESREKYRTLLELYPDDPVCAHATYYLGNIEFLLGNFEAAVASLQEVIDRWPKSEFKAKALFKLGTCHLKAGHLDKSVECFVNLAYHHKDSPLVADSMLTMAQYFSEEEKFKVAAGIGYAFVRKFPAHEKTANMYLRLAGWLIMEKRLDSAIEVLEEAEKVLPDSSNMAAFLYWHADCIFKQSRPGSVDYKRGIILLQRVTYDYPNSKWAKFAARRLAEEDVLQR